MTNKIFAVAGGDLRQIFVAKSLSSDGHKVRIFGFDNYSNTLPGIEICSDIDSLLVDADCVIFPLPYSSDGVHLNTPYLSYTVKLCDIYEKIRTGMTVFGGRFSSRELNSRGIKTIDYFEREELQILNAVPTAEGAIYIAMQERPYTVCGSKCLVVGYGRIGKVLSLLLKGLNASVTVSARRFDDLASIRSMGMKAIKTKDIADTAGEYDMIFNTVPALVIDKTVLSSVKKNSLIIDLASKPGGVDFSEAKALGINAVWSLSLPGKVAPVSAGGFIKDTIVNIIEQEEEK